MSFHYAISLGSNLGERLQFLQNSIYEISKEMIVRHVSLVYQTAPMYVDDQPSFLNAAAIVESNHQPRAMLARLKQIEQCVGRETTFRHGPRQVDMDIILCQDHRCPNQIHHVTWQEAHLQIPHGGYQERAFVLHPLAEIAGDWQDPYSGQTVRMLAQKISSAQIVHYGALRLPDTL